MLLTHWSQPKITVREETFPDGSVHVVFTKELDKERALIALAAFKKSVAGIKPRPNGGATAAVRALRDGL